MGIHLADLVVASLEAEAGFLGEWRKLRKEMMQQAADDGVTPAGIRQLSAMADRYREDGIKRIRGIEMLATFNPESSAH